MERKAIISILSMMLVAMLILSGCSKSSSGSAEDSAAPTEASATPAPTAAPEPEKDVDLKIINFRVEDKAFYDEINAKFEQEYPNIHIKYDAIPTKDYPQLKQARLVTGDIDIIGGGVSDAMDVTQNINWLDLTGQPFLENFNPGSLKAVQFNGKQFLMPTSTVSEVVFYNKKIFSDLGLSVPKTWSEFIEVCDKIKASGIDPIIFGGKDQWPVAMIIIGLEIGIIQSEQPDFYDHMRTEETKFTDPGWIEVWTKLEKLGTYFQKNALGLAYAEAPGLFGQGKAAMTIDGSWSASQIEAANPDFEVGVFLVPGNDKAENNTIAPSNIGSGWLVYKDAPNKDAALKYLAFLARQDNFQRYTDVVKMLPTVKDIKMGSPLAQDIANLLSGQQTKAWEGLQISGAKYTYVESAIQMFLGEMKPEDAAAKMQKDFTESKPNWK